MERHPADRSSPFAARRRALLALIVAFQLAGISAAAAAGPFAGFSGSWAGDGTVTFRNGATEGIRCRSQYRTSDDDNALIQTLRCASPSYLFEVEAELSHQGGQLSGTWTETQYDITGQVSGTVVDGRFRAVVGGTRFGGSVNVTASPNAQAVTIRPQDQRVSEVSIQLRRN